MIHQLLKLTRPLIVPDCETTSLDTQTARIVELGFQVWDAEGLKKEWRTFINPGIPIPAESTKTHHITDSQVRGCRQLMINADLCSAPADHMWHKPSYPEWHEFKPWPSFRDLAANLAKGFSNCDFAGKNVRYDLRVLDAEMRRAGVAWSYAGARIVDADRLEQLGEPRTLAALYKKHLGETLTDAHQALADVRATIEVIVAQLGKYVHLPRDLDTLHALQWPGLLDADGKFRMVDGVATCQFGKHRGRAMKDIPVEYYDWLLSADFPEDVKRLAAEAKMGKFPS